MRAIKLLIFGVLGVLGTLRGLELLLIARAPAPAMIPLGIGLIFLVLFIQVWKKKNAGSAQAK